VYGQTKLAWKAFLEEQSRRERDRYVVAKSSERAPGKRRSYRNGYYVRDLLKWLGTLRLRFSRSRDRSFRPPGIGRFQRRAEEVLMLIREAFLWGISTRQQAVMSARLFCTLRQKRYLAMVKRIEQDLPELLSFFDFPRRLWRKLGTTNVIEWCSVDVRRRTHPRVCSVNAESADRIIYAIFNGYNEKNEWRNRTLRLFTQAA
jgi:transposase-like protein